MPMWLVIVLAALLISLPLVGLAVGVWVMIKEDREDRRREEGEAP